jgi:hypothetical protein
MTTSGVVMENKQNTNSNNIFKNKWLVGLLIFTLIGLAVTIVLRLVTPQEPAIKKTEFITTNKSGANTDFSNIRFTGSPPAPIAELPVAAIQPSQTSLEYVKNQLISEYNLVQVAGLEGLWRGENFNLSYNNGDDEYLFYSLNIPAEIVLGDTNQAIDRAQNFVNQTFPNLELTVNKEKIRYLTGLEELNETNRNNAVTMEIPFNYTIEGVPVYVSHERGAPIAVMINSQYEIQKVVFQPNFLNFIPAEGKLKLIDLSTALDNINNNNEASVIDSYSKQGEFFTLNKAVSGELDSVQLEYRADLNTGIAYPFYRFTGELTNEASQTIQVQIITPAVKTQ